ncbi:hypothetical protein [Vibrio mexicanus]|uniref:hypothetical protein n=1 Tax=Vibrio mexicanus TaxID=1004326 RepID=UPI000A97DEAC|nr:hypothetical protein [Vibrio mexicanus]
MTEQNTESKFQEFRNSLKAEQFNSIDFLKAKAEQIESSDPLLAKRILQRVNSLDKQAMNKKTEERFQSLREALSAQEFNSTDFLESKAKSLKPSDPLLAQRILVRVKNLQENQKKKSVSEGLELKIERKPSQDGGGLTLKSNQASSSNEELLQVESRPYIKMQKWISANLFLILVVLPTVIFALYQNFWASDRYDSQAQVIVQQPDGMATMDTSMALLTGLGVGSAAVSDTELVKAIFTLTIC